MKPQHLLLLLLLAAGLFTAAQATVTPQAALLTNTTREVLPTFSLSSGQIAPAIFEGSPADPALIARTVKLHVCFSGPPSPTCPQVCTGSIISNRHILTAAHCVYTANGFAESIQVANQGGRFLDAASIAVHTGFIAHIAAPGSILRDDIAVIRLRKRLSSRSNTAPYDLLLTSSLLPAPGSDVRVAGHGLTTATSGVSATLMQGNATLLASSACRGYENFGFICTDTKRASGVLCPGDSGGPLYVRDGSSFTLIGVNSAVLIEQFDADGNFIEEPEFKCGDANTDHIYASVPNYSAAILSCFKSCSTVWRTRNTVYRF